MVVPTALVSVRNLHLRADWYAVKIQIQSQPHCFGAKFNLHVRPTKIIDYMAYMQQFCNFKAATMNNFHTPLM